MMGCEKTRIRLDDWLDGLLDESARGEVNDDFTGLVAVWKL